jgi:hypothetical protein
MWEYALHSTGVFGHSAKDRKRGSVTYPSSFLHSANVLPQRYVGTVPPHSTRLALVHAMNGGFTNIDQRECWVCGSVPHSCPFSVVLCVGCLDGGGYLCMVHPTLLRPSQVSRKCTLYRRPARQHAQLRQEGTLRLSLTNTLSLETFQAICSRCTWWGIALEGNHHPRWRLYRQRRILSA